MIPMFQFLLLATAYSSRVLLDSPYFPSSDVYTTWYEARDFCVNQGGQLATFHSIADIAAMVDTCTSTTNFCYVGFNDIDLDGTYQFVTGEAMSDLAAWSSSEPHGGAGWHCGLVRGTGPAEIFDGVCNDRTPETPIHAVCEWTTSLECGEGSSQHQIGGLNADGSGDPLEVRYDVVSVTDCMGLCRDDPDCNAYTWAPKHGDKDHPSSTVCTLYPTDEADATAAGPNQILCRPCYRSRAEVESMTIEDDLNFVTRHFVNDAGTYDVWKASIAASVFTTSILFAVFVSVFCLFVRCRRTKKVNWEEVANNEEVENIKGNDV